MNVGFRDVRFVLGFPLLFSVALLSGCMRYLTHDRDEVLLPTIDVDQTLRVATMDMAEGGRGMSLSLWALRDQVLTPGQARRVSELYFTYIDSLPGTFDTWHLTWAIANMYRHGGPEVKAALDKAYQDATARAANTHRLADLHVNGDKIYMGDAHSGGRRAAKKHLVVPGREGYLQSAEEFEEGE